MKNFFQNTLKWWFGSKYERTASMVVLVGTAMCGINSADMIFHFFENLNIALESHPLVNFVAIALIVVGLTTLALGKYFDRFPTQTSKRDKEKVDKLFREMNWDKMDSFFDRLNGRSLSKEERHFLYDIDRFLNNPENQFAHPELKKKCDEYQEYFEKVFDFHSEHFFIPDNHTISRFKFPMRDGRQLTHEQYLEFNREFGNYIKSMEEAWKELLKTSQKLGHV